MWIPNDYFGKSFEAKASTNNQFSYENNDFVSLGCLQFRIRCVNKD